VHEQCIREHKQWRL